MKKLRPRFTLRTDGRTVSDDLREFRADTERYERVMKQLRDELFEVPWKEPNEQD